MINSVVCWSRVNYYAVWFEQLVAGIQCIWHVEYMLYRAIVVDDVELANPFGWRGRLVEIMNDLRRFICRFVRRQSLVISEAFEEEVVRYRLVPRVIFQLLWNVEARRGKSLF